MISSIKCEKNCRPEGRRYNTKFKGKNAGETPALRNSKAILPAWSAAADWRGH
jgi:hypothetical protein